MVKPDACAGSQGTGTETGLRQKPRHMGKFIPVKQSSSNGFALDLTVGGADEGDAQFKAYS